MFDITGFGSNKNLLLYDIGALVKTSKRSFMVSSLSHLGLSRLRLLSASVRRCSTNTPTATATATAVMDSESNLNPLRLNFESYCAQLNTLNDKRERLVKSSRDVTQNSKKVIFQVHRINNTEKDAVLGQAEKDLERVTKQYMSQIAKELQDSDNDYWKLRRAYSPGVQEYVEAATTLEFCKTGELLTLEDINNRLSNLIGQPCSSFKINVIDYVLGVGDLTGELMRLAISQVAEGDINMARRICDFVRDLYRNLSLISPILDDQYDMNKKMEVMLQSLMKIENACYNVHVRSSEKITYPEMVLH